MKQLILIVFFLFITVILFIITLPPKGVTLKDLQPEVIPRAISREPVKQDTTPIDTAKEVFSSSSPNEFEEEENAHSEGIKTALDAESEVEYYIIVEGFSNQLQARQRAEKLKKDFSADIIVLPPTAEGFYRISFGKYTTLEAAKSSIQSIRTKVKSDAWILSLKK
jgi:hypothetical protein